MAHPFEEIKKELAQASDGALALREIVLEKAPPFLALEFDLCSPLGFPLAKTWGLAPLEAAKRLVQNLDSKLIDKIDVRSPGYVNLKLKTLVFQKVQEQILAERGRYPLGYGASGPQSVLLEFCSANPTGPLHVGHIRGAILGDTLARVLTHAGVRVFKEFYINDVGVQIRRLGESLQARFLEDVMEQKDIPFPKEGYQGNYVRELARQIPRDEGQNFSVEDFAKFAQEKILKGVKADLNAAGVTFDRWFPESELHNKGLVRGVIDNLKSKGFAQEKEGALWLVTPEIAEKDKERVLQKSSGDTTYFASDLAYHQEKFSRGYDLVVNIWGADHHGYVPRMRAGLKALGLDESKFSVILIQMVRLVRDGKVVTLSKREGEILAMREVVDEVGLDAARFFLNARSANAQLDFDLDLAKKHAMENPVYLVQYAHARICSLKKEKDVRGIVWDENLNPTPEDDLKTRELFIHLGLLGETTRQSVKQMATQYVTNYLVELARLFHAYYETHQILAEKNEALALARYRLCLATDEVLLVGLNILGISAPERM